MIDEKIAQILRLGMDSIMRVLNADRVYAAFFNEELSIYEIVAPTNKEKLPINLPSEIPKGSLPYKAILSRKALLYEINFEYEIKKLKIKYWPQGTLPKSWLGVPIVSKNYSIGLIVAENTSKPNAFGADGFRFATAVINELTVSIQLEKKNIAQQAVHNIGVKLAEGIQRGEKEIAKLIKEHADKVMDTNNMYVALYEPDPSDVFDAKNPNNCTVHGSIRFELMFIDGKPTSMDSRTAIPGKYGRTEVILATRKPILIKKKKEAIDWYYDQPGHKDHLGRTFVSWVGVPMITGGKVIGVIATYDTEDEEVYTEGDQQVLSMMANQAAVAIDNARLYAELNKSKEKEKWSYMGRIAGSLAHRIGNKCGMIRLCVLDLKDHFKDIYFEDKFSLDQLDIIEQNNGYILDLSKYLFKPLRAISLEKEKVDVMNYLEDAIYNANIPEDINIVRKLPKNSLYIIGNKYPAG